MYKAFTLGLAITQLVMSIWWMSLMYMPTRAFTRTDICAGLAMGWLAMAHITWERYYGNDD